MTSKGATLIQGPNAGSPCTSPTSQQTAAGRQIFVYFSPACFKHRLSVINICYPQTVAEIIMFPKDREDEEQLFSQLNIIVNQLLLFQLYEYEGSATTRGKTWNLKSLCFLKWKILMVRNATVPVAHI